ncbi:MAG: GntR family transcriptional regulator [Roseibium album]|uniref:GntR family transcriptional regulator n=1 Tax=Roseibium album TaxID=311410 RepID=UPI000CF188B3|nr:GntR family transcriptional regulator [Roseibium album]MBG6147253.1 DNA-binding GntR family transcriptional regulator [Labrenzia sp. EL_142]MBG6165963.1 DNA-binding GntR family transcriptional regulator [Labrenzia sp. EL_195]MBG6177934.1 DNA-binding GntR family transcriptional regulator [Labrenzia sp. EL_132]MBG6204845.1 DNA-binding GntR family transcriptional regulator [Labrenzia sp. EL_13]MBG6232557.1 DNA-binding GntR family transcriptional regulator [Labrenzia sp. EL_208]
MKLTSMDISTTASASSIVFDALRKAIIQGQLEEGEPLRQDEIARLFNTSRIPVREAISRLEEQGLVKTQRYKGAVVAGLSPKETEEIFDLRALVEPEIIKNAVPRMSKEILASAREKCAAFSASDNPMEWGDLNRDFHETLYSASDLKFFREIAHNAIDRVERQIRAQLVMSNGMERAGREHFGIMDACEAGDADLAADLTGEHILGAKKSLLAHIQDS